VCVCMYVCVYVGYIVCVFDGVCMWDALCVCVYVGYIVCLCDGVCLCVCGIRSVCVYMWDI